MSHAESPASVESIAVIGLTGRFPCARNVEEFWQNLLDGRETITQFTDQELGAAGIDPVVAKLPGFVNAGSILSDIDQFDAPFFGYSARDAESIDPQQRLFLECAWECLESAGYNPDAYGGLIGVFAGSDMSSYLYQLYANVDPLSSGYGGMIVIGNDKDYLTTQVSYKLNLRGPSIAVQTSCSTSLVAVCLACQNLWSYGCDMALAGGASVSVPQKKGYFYMPGGILSPDGHCRTFDAEGQGTIIGNGVGVVLLKRLSDALADGDTIHAVIKGAALNNDGSAKVGYTAPSIAGQAQVIAMAQSMAGVDPETIGYVEAHGTATLLGDPIEVAALTQAFGARTSKKNYCALGSVKSNVGHLASAAGVTGLIKTVLSIERGILPASLNFKSPNPQIDFKSSPFFVNDTQRAWERNGSPRRAGVSSFGVGGTNAHVVLEEAPAVEPSGPSRAYQVVPIAAKSPAALDRATSNLAAHLRAHPDLSLADVSFTQAARRPFAHRRVAIAPGPGTAQAADLLESRDAGLVITGSPDSTEAPVLFMFSGQGSQYVDMGLGLYRAEPIFRSILDDCCERLRPDLGFDLREVLYPDAAHRDEAAARLQRTAITQPALFALEYSLAKLWMEFGIEPKAMIGHSIGEYVAACLAGVFSLEDALHLVAARGRLMDEMPGGAMLAAQVSEAEAQALTGDGVSVAAVNAAELCVLSGPTAAIEAIAEQLARNGRPGRVLHTSHAFHSSMMDPVVEPFVQIVQRLSLKPPQIPLLSNLTGTWLAPDTAVDPGYWGRHLRRAVRFGDGIAEILKYPEISLLEIGPGQALCTLARQQAASPAAGERAIVPSLRPPHDSVDDDAFFLRALGALWVKGAPINWGRFFAGERRCRVPLPTYPFERQRYWIGPVEDGSVPAETERKARDVTTWFYAPHWVQQPALVAEANPAPQRWLVFARDEALGAEITDAVLRRGHDVWTVVAGDAFAQVSDRRYTIRPDDSSDYARLVNDLIARSGPPDQVLHGWTAAPGDADSSRDGFDAHQTRGFFSLLFLAQALQKASVTSDVRIAVVSRGLHAVEDRDPLCPAKATLLGACKVLPQEFSYIRCKAIDIGDATDDEAADAERIVAECAGADPMVAYRDGRRLTQEFEPTPIDKGPDTYSRLRRNGVYLITGGLGNIGLALAEALAADVQAKLILVGRSPFPTRATWEQRLVSGPEDSVTRKIRRLLALESLGAEVMVASADSADESQMAAVFDAAYERFGVVHGVIHGSGNTAASAFVDVGHTDRRLAEDHFAPKAHGVMVLERLLRDREVDFVLLLSSLSGVLGGLGLLGYASANIFLDAFAAQQNRAQRTRWISVNWDAWQFPGQEAAFRQSASPGGDFLYPAEGVECCRRILENAPEQIVVSASDLHARIAKWIHLESLRQPAKVQGGTASLHARPSLSSQFVPPRNPTETTIAEIWESILGITPIGVHDRFFELGGHSLLAIQLISRMREAFHVELSAQRLFEAPTIAQLAETIQADIQALRLAEDAEARRSEEMLQMVEALSDEEVAALLAKQDDSLNIARSG